jgi:phosphomannomutase
MANQPAKSNGSPAPEPTRRIFGTDGVRGTANIEPVTAETALKLGRAAAHVFTQMSAHRGRAGGRATIVIGKDTRLSGYMLENALAAGVMSLGADVILIGPLPTPGVAYITRSLRADAGIVLSASHNPYEDNGIKIFSADGKKIDEATERAIERDIQASRSSNGTAQVSIDIADEHASEYQETYLEHLENEVDGLRLDGLRLAVDCANGAASRLAPDLLRRLGAHVIAFNDRPDGRNINLNCGSLHLEQLQAKVVEENADFGVAFDGDADRCFAVDEKGETISGDLLATLVAKNVLEKEPGATILYSAVCSKAFPELVESEGGRAIRTKAGHSIIKPQMREYDAAFGGEHSGHFYFRDNYFADSGIIAMLTVAELVARQEGPLSELLVPIDPYVRSGEINSEVGDQEEVLERIEEHYAQRDAPKIDHLDGLTVDYGDWWFNLRPSNTEPLLRLNVEARDRETMERERDELLGLIRG